MRRQARDKWVRAVLLAILVLVVPLPADAAIYDYPYPKAENKKGLLIFEDFVEDALELNISHATINFPISEIFATDGERRSGRAYSYQYKGTTYWISKPDINRWDKCLKKLQKNNVIVNGILLVMKNPNLKRLVYPAARRKKSSGYYAWNMDGGKNQKQLEAAISFLARRYSSGKHGRVVGWIVGNEINSASAWNAAGDISFSRYMDLYARMFEASSRIIKGIYANARLYIPLDHYWTIHYKNDYNGKDCLDAFAARMKKDGYDWNLAYHAYNGDMMQPSITDKQRYGTTDKVTTPIITMKNLGVLTKYIRKNFGEKTRIILSEQGYSSTWKGKNVSKQQSEAVALSYYLAMADPMVDAFMYYSQVDQNVLTKVGAAFGLWKVSKKEEATEKKPSWSVYKYVDTDRRTPVLDNARKVSGKMTGTKAAATRTWKKGSQVPCGKYSLKKAVKKGWKKCGAVRSAGSRGGSYLLSRNDSKNKNIYWGLQKGFRKLNVSGHPHLCLTVRKGRLTTGKTELMVRVFSGNRNLFEASGRIHSNKTQRIRIDLSGWSGRSRITKIQILVKRGSGRWKKNAGVVLERIGFN